MMNLQAPTQWAAITTLSADNKRTVLTWMSMEGANVDNVGLNYKQLVFNKLTEEIMEGRSTFNVEHVRYPFPGKDVTALVINSVKVELVLINLPASENSPGLDATDMDIAAYVDECMLTVNEYEVTPVASFEQSVSQRDALRRVDVATHRLEDALTQLDTHMDDRHRRNQSFVLTLAFILSTFIVSMLVVNYDLWPESNPSFCSGEIKANSIKSAECAPK
jgi:hypothetical protein